jgi:cytochrome c553
MKFVVTSLASMATMVLLNTAALAGDIAVGEKKAEVCAACHGKDGNAPIDPSYPKLGGQHKDFLVRALKDYKSGARKNAIMGGQAAQLSSVDMDNLAAYYASRTSTLSVMK